MTLEEQIVMAEKFEDGCKEFHTIARSLEHEGLSSHAAGAISQAKDYMASFLNGLYAKRARATRGEQPAAVPVLGRKAAND